MASSVPIHSSNFFLLSAIVCNAVVVGAELGKVQQYRSEKKEKEEKNYRIVSTTKNSTFALVKKIKSFIFTWPELSCCTSTITFGGIGQFK
jgi:hypothetical protein